MSDSKHSGVEWTVEKVREVAASKAFMPEDADAMIAFLLSEIDRRDDESWNDMVERDLLT